MSTLTTKDLPFFLEIFETERKLNAKVYIVGGTIRDILLGKTTADIDIIPFGVEYDKFAITFAKSIRATYIPFKDNIRIVKRNIVIDVSKPRGKDIQEDVMLRDFTINNLACDLDGNLVGNYNDVINGKIKHVYENTFVDDALRIFRTFRFASQLGFDINNETMQLAMRSAPLLKNIAMERILEELRKTFKGDYFYNVIINDNFFNILKNYLCIELDSTIVTNINALAEAKDFLPLIIASAKEPLKAIDILKLTNSESKLIKNILDAEHYILNNDLNDERSMKVFAWKFLDNLNIITTYLKCKYLDNMSFFSDIFTLSKQLDVANAKNITGEMLIQMGFSPSPLFKQIISEVEIKLALNELEKNDVLIYISDNYKR